MVSLKDYKYGKKIKILMLLLIIIAVFPINIYISDNWLEVNMYDLKPDKLPSEFKGFSILQMSDNHIRSNSDIIKDKKFFNQAEKTAITNNKKIDMVVITGDLIDKRDKMIPEATAFVKEIVEKYPVYFVSGNHEWYSDLVKELSKIGVNTLENESKRLVKDKAWVWITGIKDGYTKLDDESKGFKNIPINDFDITITHSPNNFSKLTDSGADFIMCGHTHNGQIKLPFIPALYVTGQGVFPKYTYGFYEKQRPDFGRTVLYVNKGIGFSDPLYFRMFNRPEISIFTFQ